VVQLTGKVNSDIDRDLAGELAKGIEGVVDVHIQPGRSAAHRATPLQPPKPPLAVKRSFGAGSTTRTTTASVKSKLLGNPNTEGLQIDVDTRGDVVTLSGEVASAEEKALGRRARTKHGRRQSGVRKAI
jgi:osmotically-inducible protein OsmY